MGVHVTLFRLLCPQPRETLPENQTSLRQLGVLGSWGRVCEPCVRVSLCVCLCFCVSVCVVSKLLESPCAAQNPSAG